VYGSFTRCFDVSGINVDGIEASYTDGMLNVTLPKKAAEVPASRRLEIK
jgi:HSP20 family protein